MQAAAAGDARGAGEAAAAELDFGDDLRASADYRRRVCGALVTRALEEVLA
jgi:CO/xanthine dehydrogenase FAD-binding subunit